MQCSLVEGNRSLCHGVHVIPQPISSDYLPIVEAFQAQEMRQSDAFS